MTLTTECKYDDDGDFCYTHEARMNRDGSCPGPDPAPTPIAEAMREFDSHEIVDLGYALGILRIAGYTGPAPQGYDHATTRRAIVE